MCWVCYKNIKEKQYADVDIRCFKIVLQINENEYSSYFKKFHYVKGNKYELGMPMGIIHRGESETEIYEAFHLYSSDIKVGMDVEDLLTSKVVMRLGKGLVDVLYANPTTKLVKLNCIIPAGSEYYVNEIGEIASNAIQVQGHEEIKITTRSKIKRWLKIKFSNWVLF